MKYAGKSADVITTTPRYFAVEYARSVSWIHHAGASRYA
jgi:hypothetical protein